MSIGILSNVTSFETKSGCKFGAECSFPLKNKRTKNRRRMKAQVQLLVWKVYDSWVVYRMTLTRQNLQRFLGRAQKCWNQFDEHDSQRLRCVMQISENNKVRRSATSCEYPSKERTTVGKNKCQSSSSAKSLRCEIWRPVPWRDWTTAAMRPRRCVGICKENR